MCNTTTKVSKAPLVDKPTDSKQLFIVRRPAIIVLFLFLSSWHTVVCLVGVATCMFFVTTYVHGPTLSFPLKKNRNQILDDCPVSTKDVNDLILNPGVSEDDAFTSFDRHGVAMIPSILSKTTAQSFRDFAEKANHEMRQVFVLKSENRFRIMPTPFETPVVQQAMKEIYDHPTLKPLIDNMLGPSSSMIAFSVITSTYGAEAQGWHRDTIKSGMTHPDDMVHELTLTIPLQDTTEEMGSTGICPGTHRCAWVEWDEADVADDEEYEEDEDEVPCEITATLKQGDGMIYHTDAIHRGGAHVDPDAPERMVLFVSFAESKDPAHVKRLAYGKVYSLDWSMWGLTIDDFPYLGSWQWRWSFLHPLGFRFFNNAKSDRKPWTAVDSFLYIFHRSKNKCYFLSNTFNAKQMKEMSGVVLYSSLAFIGLYAWVGIPMWVFTIMQYLRLKK